MALTSQLINIYYRREYDCCKKERSGTKKSSEIENEDRSVSDSMSQSSSPLQLKCSGEETRVILKPKDKQENSRPKSELIDLHQKNLTELEEFKLKLQFYLKYIFAMTKIFLYFFKIGKRNLIVPESLNRKIRIYFLSDYKFKFLRMV